MTTSSTSHQSINNPNAQIEALHRLVTICLRHQGGGTYPIIDFLMGMYNGQRWRPNMQLLSGRIDDGYFEDVLQVMRLYRLTRMEPHTFFDNGVEIFRELSTLTKPVRFGN